MLTGVGNGSSPADTTNAQAQAWYDEGLNLYHAFNHNEARAAFAKAAEPGSRHARSANGAWRSVWGRR